MKKFKRKKTFLNVESKKEQRLTCLCQFKYCERTTIALLPEVFIFVIYRIRLAYILKIQSIFIRHTFFALSMQEWSKHMELHITNCTMYKIYAYNFISNEFIYWMVVTNQQLLYKWICTLFLYPSGLYFCIIHQADDVLYESTCWVLKSFRYQHHLISDGQNKSHNKFSIIHSSTNHSHAHTYSNANTQYSLARIHSYKVSPILKIFHFALLREIAINWLYTH